MLELLRRIYLDYYDLERQFDFKTDKQEMDFLYFIIQKYKKEQNLDNVIEEFKKKYSFNYENINQNIKLDQFYLEKSCVHITYPINFTLQRLDIIFNSIGERRWTEIFSFDYCFFAKFIINLFSQIILYNNYYIKIKNNQKINIKENPLFHRYYFTKEQFYYYFPNNKHEIDKILNLISKDINDIENKEDIYNILKYEEKYILYFIWDFSYKIYDIIESEILKYENNDKYYYNRGKVFEKHCYNCMKNLFPQNIYKNLKYDYKEGDNEIDVLIETDKEFIICECKSSKFNINQTQNDKEMKQEFIDAYGRGFITINNFNEYINMGNRRMYSKSTKEEYNFDFLKKKVIFLNISLYNMEYIQTKIQKIDKKLIHPVKIYPINLNFMDFMSIITLAQLNYEMFIKYIHRRFDCINKNKKIELDIDEMDAFGFLTDEQYEDIYQTLIKSNNKNIDMSFKIKNSKYREIINEQFNTDYFSLIINH